MQVHGAHGRHHEGDLDQLAAGVAGERDARVRPAGRPVAQGAALQHARRVGKAQPDVERDRAGGGLADGQRERARRLDELAHLEQVDRLRGAGVALEADRRRALVGRLEVVADRDGRAGALDPPAPGRLEALERQVVPAVRPGRRRQVLALAEVADSVARVEVGPEVRVDGRGRRHVVGDAVPAGAAARRVAVGADPERALVLEKGVEAGAQRLVGPVDAERRLVRLPLGKDTRHVRRDAQAARLVVHAGVEVVGVAPERDGVGVAGGEVGRGPAEVQEHGVRDAVGALLEKGVVLGVELLLPEDGAGLRHGVVPLDPQVRVGLEVEHEVLEVRRERGVAAGGLLVDKPPVEAVVLGHLDQLVGDGEGVALALHEVAHPLDLAAEDGRREKDRPQDGRAVAVRGVGHAGVGRQDEALAGGAAPEHQQVGVGPVAEGVVVGVEAALRGIAARGRERRERVDARLAGAGVGGRLEAGHVEAGPQRHAGAVVGGVGVRGRAPVEQRVRVPVRGVGLVRGQRGAGALGRGGRGLGGRGHEERGQGERGGEEGEGERAHGGRARGPQHRRAARPAR